MKTRPPRSLLAKLFPLLVVGAGIVTASTAVASPPAASTGPTDRKAKRELIAGGVLVGLGFVSEVGSATIAVTCATGTWCSRGFALTLGPSEGPNRYSIVSTGPSSAYIGGRMAAAPLLMSGIPLLMVGVAHLDIGQSTWTRVRHKRVSATLLGLGLGILVGSRVVRATALGTGVCQSPLCVHGFDQATLWTGRSLTFAGTGMLIRNVGGRVRWGVEGGPGHSNGLSLVGQF
jgi:hypothetical protein